MLIRCLWGFGGLARFFCGPLPEVEAFLEQRSDDGAWVWIVRRCRCGKQHLHGGGLCSEDDPRRLLGPRAAPCGGAYEIIDGAPEVTARLLAGGR